MELVSLACGHCGAPLEVPEGTRYVTCGYCCSKLEIHRSGGAIYTEVLESLQKHTEKIAGDVEILKLQNELERLDREWQADRESCMIRGKHGQMSEPSPVAGTLAAIIAIGFGCFWMITAGASPAPGIALFGLVFIGVGIFAFVSNLTKSSKYSEKKEAYERRRAEMLRKLRDCESGRQ